MKIDVVCFGRLKTPGFTEAEAFFQKRIRPWAKIEIHNLKATKVDHDSEIEIALKKDAELIRKTIMGKSQRQVFLMMDKGINWSTDHWAEMLGGPEQDISLVIGSSYGLSSELQTEFPQHISLGRQTFSQGVIRIALLEQIYRGLSVVRGHPYHHG